MMWRRALVGGLRAVTFAAAVAIVAGVCWLGARGMGPG
jgi:hypothetical protein